jgi:hypothetical protein
MARPGEAADVAFAVGIGAGRDAGVTAAVKDAGADAYVDAVAGEPPLRETTRELAKSSSFQTQTDGIVSRTLPIVLRRNAVVRRFDVVVQAARADATLLGTAAQVRKQSEHLGLVTVVADFGTPRTVSSVGVVDGSPIDIGSVTTWTGVAFAASPVYSAVMKGDATTHQSFVASAPPPSTGKRAIFSEVRTERLMLTLVGESDIATIAAEVWVHLPDLPSDLELRLGPGAPVWTSPGPVQPGARGFDAEARQTVPLADVLNALAGDLTDDSEQALSLVLSSRVPGRLELTQDTARTVLRYLAAIDLGPEGQHELVFDTEGLREVVLALPAWVAAVEQVSLTLIARLPAERVLPPVGPPVASVPGDPGGAAVAELVLDADHAACVRLPAATRLVDSVGVRLPVRADAGGAEARVVLLQGTDGSTEPGGPVDGATSAPVVLADGAGQPDPFTTFAFPQPVAIRDDALPWAALVPSRGRVCWTLGQLATAADVAPVRRGPPAGPWRALPGLLASDPTIGGRLRVVGHAAAQSPVAPLVIDVVGREPGARRPLDATPTARGVRVDWRVAGDGEAAPLLQPAVDGSGPAVRLQVVSRTAGTVTIRDVEIVATREANA